MLIIAGLGPAYQAARNRDTEFAIDPRSRRWNSALKTQLYSSVNQIESR